MDGVTIAVMTMFDNLRSSIQDLREQWDELMWKISDERQKLASNRLAAHNLALKERRNSPYTHPEEYDFLSVS